MKQVDRDGPTKLAAQGDGVEVVYFEVWLPQSSIDKLPGGGAFFSFSSNESTGQNGFQLLLSSTQRYQGMLLPEDALFAQAVRDALGAPLVDDTVSVIVSSVVF